MTESELAERSAAGAKAFETTLEDAGDKVLGRLRQQSDRGESFDILAMSGGGDHGAFGAGLLVGWGAVADPEWRRPEFDVVTGVSTGALISPFAFVGTDEACRRVDELYRHPKKDWVRSRGLFFFWPSNSSFMEIPGLHRDLGKAVDESIIEQVAEGSRSGRVLLVSATDLDFGRQRVWDVGQEAEAATTDEARSRVHSTLLASAAVPAVFPPIEMDGSAYADGGVTANVFVRLNVRSPRGVLQRWLAEHPGVPLPKVRYWVIINNQLAQVPKTVEMRWLDVAEPSLSTSIRWSTITEVRLLAAEADYVNAAYGTDIEVRVASIPDSWRPPVKGSFKSETMNSLADLGESLGRETSSWSIWTLPRAAHATQRSSTATAPGW